MVYPNFCQHYVETLPSGNWLCKACGLYIFLDNDKFGGADYQPNMVQFPLFSPGQLIKVKNHEVYGIVQGYQIEWTSNSQQQFYIYYVEIQHGFEMPPRNSMDHNLIINTFAMRFLEFQLEIPTPSSVPHLLDEGEIKSELKIQDSELSI